MALSPEKFNNAKYTTALDTTTRKAIAASTVLLGPMVASEAYLLTSDIDCFYLQGTSAVTATSTTGHPLWAKSPILIDAGDDATATGYISVVSTGTGTVYLSKVTK